MSENKIATKADLQRMYNKMLPYLGGTAEAGFTPVGTVIAVMGNTAPANYLTCNGQIVNIADYSILADYFETQFGSKNHFGGDGTTTFAVPDLRGEFLRGTGTNSHVGQGNGSSVGTHQDGTVFPRYAISGTNSYTQHVVERDTVYKAIENTDSVYSSTNTKYANQSVSFTNYNENNGYAYTSRPTNTSVLYCIATHNIFINPELQYSTQEQVVGTWVDGKPLYQKTIDCGYLLNSNRKSVPHNIANIDKIIEFNAFSYAYDTLSDNAYFRPLPYLWFSDNTWQSSHALTADKTNIIIATYSDRTSEYAYVTIQYTKTTD